MVLKNHPPITTAKNTPPKISTLKKLKCSAEGGPFKSSEGDR